MTYAELKSLVQNYLQNTETTFVSDLPKLIEKLLIFLYLEKMLVVHYH